MPVAHHLPARGGRARPGVRPPSRAGGGGRVGRRGRRHRRRDGRVVGGRGRRLLQRGGRRRPRCGAGAAPEDADDALGVLTNLPEAPDVTCEDERN